MRALRTSLGAGLAGALAIVSFLAFSAAAGAKGHCYVNTKPRYPTVTAPCPRARIAPGAHVTFVVRDLNPSAGRYKPFLILTKHAPRHGIVPSDTSGNGLYDQLKPVRGHHGRFQDRPTQHSFPGYWNVTPGKYYVQIHQIESGCTTRHCTVYSPVTTIIVR